MYRNLKLKVLFRDQKEEPVKIRTSEISFLETGLRKTSQFMPNINVPAVDTFMLAVRNGISSIRQTLDNETIPQNMTWAETCAIKRLMQDDSLTIKPADKGGAVVVMDSSKYTAEIRRQLSDVNVYEPIGTDPKFRLGKIIGQTVEEAFLAKIIDLDLKNFLIVDQPITPVIYCLPKIHKSLIDPPGRPIVSGQGSIFNPITMFLDKILRQYAQKARSYIKDTPDFLQKLKDTRIAEDCILVSFDVTNLYTSINHRRGLEKVENQLLESTHTSECITFILNLLEIVLTENYFLFECGFYRQLRGTAMGANMAPTYANIFMKALEEDMVYTSDHFAQVAMWLRYIDDIFVIWKGTQAELDLFFTFLNEMDMDIKFTMTSSLTEVQFLDTLVYRTEEGFKTDLYTKPTDRNNLLLYSSHHPKPMLQSLPYSQLLRVKRIVDDPEKRTKRLDEMCEKFHERGYPRSLIKKHRKNVDTLNKNSLVGDKKDTSTEPRITFVTTYSGVSDSIRNLIRKEWHILGDALTNVKEFEIPPRIAYRRKKNVKDKLVRAVQDTDQHKQPKIFKSKRKGCFPCLKCNNCTHMIRGDTFTHPKTNEKFKINTFLTCSSTHVIYVLQCPCNLLYVGETTMMCRVRINKHKSTIRTKRIDLPVSKLFLDFGHKINDLKFAIIDQIPVHVRGGDRTLKLKRKELEWIFRLNTLTPHGLNIEFKVLPNMV